MNAKNKMKNKCVKFFYLLLLKEKLLYKAINLIQFANQLIKMK